MKAAYVDSSILVAILFHERGFKSLIERLNLFDELLSSALIEAEVLASATREGLDFMFQKGVGFLSSTGRSVGGDSNQPIVRAL